MLYKGPAIGDKMRDYRSQFSVAGGNCHRSGAISGSKRKLRPVVEILKKIRDKDKFRSLLTGMDKLDSSRVDDLFYNMLVSCIEMYTQFISFVVAHIYAS